MKLLYRQPSVSSRNIDFFQPRFQVTGEVSGLLCDGELPSACGNIINFGNDIGSTCFFNFGKENAVYSFPAFASGTNCAQGVSHCSITINGQDATKFCSSGWAVSVEQECAEGCLFQYDCVVSAQSCDEIQVEISCPGYENCLTTSVEI